MTPLTTETQLVSLALALVDRRRLTAAEAALARAIPAASRKRASELAAAVQSGGDPLGDAFTRLRTPEERRPLGATYTPAAIVAAMTQWAMAELTPARIVDPGAGSGRFLMAAGTRFPRARLVGIEIDPLAALLTRANLAALGFADRADIIVADYRMARLPAHPGATLFIGNPPYVRHHDITAEAKAWYATSAARYGVTASKLAGLHLHFFLRTLELAGKGDVGCFITAAEWLDVNYGAALRQLLAGPLGGTALTVIDPKALPFDDAATTSAITGFRVLRRPPALKVSAIASLKSLASPPPAISVPWSRLAAAPRWSIIIKPGEATPTGHVELGELCRVHRGQVTGANDVWIAGASNLALPARFLKPTITKARELIAAGSILADDSELRRVIDLPPDLDTLTLSERRAIERFLAWARRHGAHETYIARHRRAWWSVGLKDPAPILCTYMARRPPAFVRNLCNARHINIAHGLYPREPLTPGLLDALATWLRSKVSLTQGRTYAGGLTKFEPKEVERLPIPDPAALAAGAFA